jgi:hypothetical protein
MATGSDLELRRIVVALDAAADIATAIGLAASVARSLELELHAMLVEDENLRRLVDLPFVQAVDTATAQRAPFDLAALRREMDLTAARIRRLLESCAAAQPLPWSFEVRQAAIGAEPADLAQNELLALGMASRPVAGLARMRSPWRATVSRMRRPLLLIAEQAAAEGGVVALYGAHESDNRGIETSLRIARAWRKPLTVLVPETLATAAQREIRARLQSDLAGAVLKEIAAPSPKVLREFLKTAAASLAVLRRESLTEDGDLEAFLGAPPRSLLLI